MKKSFTYNNVKEQRRENLYALLLIIFVNEWLNIS